MEKMIEFTIDGKNVSAAPGETILTVAVRNNISIPTLCFNTCVSRNTTCLVCVVRDMKSGRFIPACTALPAPGQEIDASGETVRDMRKTALELLLSEHNGDCEAPCRIACPAHADVERYVREGKNGRWTEAIRIIKERIPLPMSVGRVCPRFCEKKCRKNLFGAPVDINDFKRKAAEEAYDSYMEEIAPDNGSKVAVVGAGPAGLAVAYYLRLAGCRVTVFEQMPRPGGMLRYGIPEYRLPKEKVLDRELVHFERLGVEFRFNCRVGRDISLKELAGSFDAAALAYGCWQASPMKCPGEEFAVQGIDFLRSVAEKRFSGAPGRVAVVGGGNTAMDCLRTSVRLGAKEVTCVYRRGEAEMPAEKAEIREAREEGVRFTFLTAPVEIRKEADGLKMVCVKMQLGEPDASGRRRPEPVPGSEFTIPCDTIIAAIGQKPAPIEGLPVNRYGYCGEVTELEGCKFFAAGDCLTGPATVVEALGGARHTASEILVSLGHKPLPMDSRVNVSRGEWQSMTPEDVVKINPELSEAGRIPEKLIDIDRRKNTFDEVALTQDAEDLAREGARCIECSCAANQDCKLRKLSEEYGASVDTFAGAKPARSADTRHPAIIRDAGKCVKCGICIKVCGEVVNQYLLGFGKRGFAGEVMTAFGAPLPASCARCGKCVEACPVGALTWRDQKTNADHAKR